MAALAARLGFDELYAATVGRLSTATATCADLSIVTCWTASIRFFRGSVRSRAW
jgi:hypothetical protein